MAKTKYFTNLSELNSCTASKKLVALIGTQKEPLYAVFYSKSIMGTAYYVSVEEKDEEIDREWVSPSSAMEAVKNVVKEYESIIDEYESKPLYCNNPECPEQGLVIEPLMEEDGRVVCPSCGKELEEEEKFEISHERLLEIAGMLIEFIEDDSFEKEDFRMYCKCADLESYEIDKLRIY